MMIILPGSCNYRSTPDGKTIPLENLVDYLSLYDKENNCLYESEIDEEFGELTIFVGVMPKTLEAFKKWMFDEIKEEHSCKSFDKWFNSIDWEALTRFNQGDAFFVGSQKCRYSRWKSK